MDAPDWLAELDDATWQVSDDGRREIEASIGPLAARFDDSAAAELRIESDDGTVYGHEVLVGVGRDAVRRARDALGAEQLDETALADLVGALNDLHVVALAAALADDDPSGDHGPMAIADFFSRRLADAWGTLEGSVVPIGSGRYRLRWRSADRRVTAALATELDALLDTDDDSVVRLFPPAYGTDEDRSREWAALARDELVTSRRASLAILESALDRREVDEEELVALMRAINDLRLVVGTRLDVTEDDDRRPPISDPAFETWVTYHRLSRMLGQIVTALAD